jgi:cytochrome b561
MKRHPLPSAGQIAKGIGGQQEHEASQARYTRTAITLHWLIAALVVAMLLLGLVMTDVPRQTPMRGTLFNLHKSLGLVVLVLLIARLAWRLSHHPPPLPADVAPWSRQLAGLTHAAFYVLLLAQPLLGYVASVFGKYGVKFFGVALPAWSSDNPAVREPFLDAHHLVARLLIGLIALHLAGVAWHRFGRRGDLWRRMWW